MMRLYIYANKNVSKVIRVIFSGLIVAVKRISELEENMYAGLLAFIENGQHCEQLPDRF